MNWKRLPPKKTDTDVRDLVRNLIHVSTDRKSHPGRDAYTYRSSRNISMLHDTVYR